MARAMKDSGIEWIGEIPEGWEVYPALYAFKEVKTKNSDGAVKNALQFKYGAIVPKENFDADDDEYVANTIVNYTVVQPGVIMINGLNLNYDFVTQRVALVKDYGVITSAYLALSPDKSKITPEYATYLFKGYDAKQALHNMGSGLRLTLGYKELKRQPVLFPSMSEQGRIVKFLDGKLGLVDEVTDLTRRTIAEYKKLKQSLITEAVTRGIRGSRPLKPSGVDWIGDIPEEWEVAKLGSIAKLRNGYVGPTRNLFCDDGIKYIQSLHIKDGAIDFSKEEYYVPAEWADKHPKIHKDNLLIVQTGDIGQVGLVTNEYDNCNCHALIIVDMNVAKIMPIFMMYYFLSKVGKELLLDNRTGALLPHLNSGKIKFTPVVLPALDEQREIADYLDARCATIDSLVSAKQRLITELEKYKKSLIYEYVTGKRQAP